MVYTRRVVSSVIIVRMRKINVLWYRNETRSNAMKVHLPLYITHSTNDIVIVSTIIVPGCIFVLGCLNGQMYCK